MNDHELQQLVVAISKADFGQPFLHVARFNHRLRSTGGRYLLQTHDIEINPKMLTEHNQATLVGVIKHELVHYHLHLSGQASNHGSLAFKQLLAQVDGLAFAPISPKQGPAKYVYQCRQCGQQYPRRRQINVLRYVCRQCHGKLQLIEN